MHSNRTARLLLHDPQPIGLHPPHFRGEGAVRRQQPQLLDLHLPQSHQATRAGGMFTRWAWWDVPHVLMAGMLVERIPFSGVHSMSCWFCRRRRGALRVLVGCFGHGSRLRGLNWPRCAYCLAVSPVMPPASSPIVS